MIFTIQELKRKQALSLDEKIKIAQDSISAWYDAWDGAVYCAFSGGKDSTVLLDLVHRTYPDVPAVFSDTGLEYPEVKSFAKKAKNVVLLRPKMPFHKVVEKFGYPVISKKQAQNIYECQTAKRKGNEGSKTWNLHMTGTTQRGKYIPSLRISEKWKYLIDAPFKISHKCCDELKKKPFKIYEKETGRKPIIGIMATDSRSREQRYLMYGCNYYGKARQISAPMSIFNTADVWEYIKRFDLPYSKIYDMGYERTGCIFCMFGVHLEKGLNKFQLLQKTHQKLHEYCINNLECGKVLDYINVPYENKQIEMFPDFDPNSDE